ncbi:MFS general substrate transporter [Lojkania enalia]|uniref:MFS general substrate transporter n=1 Tax=Lojkania enalia TaxID=147567 RepID=A0A9P4MZY8_9PLEO|nr:MFS general substrate transporter [Didymosphaeria enalia]
MVFIAAFAALFSPFSSTIYYPALQPLAQELHVSNSLITLTITTFLFFQGLAPAFIGAFSDASGRRPAYLVCFIIYMAANIGLALQKNYAALLVLRCVQSSGSSGTVALANAVVADVSLPHERGRWMGWANAAGLLGPTIGPIIGGLLSQYLGWRAIFWFLTIFGGVYLLPILFFFPESCRNVVGNGARRPLKWDQCFLDPLLQKRIDAEPSTMCPPIAPHPLRFPNPLKTFVVFLEKEACLILIASSFYFAGFYGLMACLPSQFEENYHLNSLQIGLCFLASGIGGSLAALISGRLMDKNFRRHARKLGLDARDTRRIRSLSSFPIEAARLEIALPLVVVGAAMILAFGWVMHFRVYLAGPLIFLFFIGFTLTGAFTIMTTLIVDLFPEKPATAAAAGNMSRCWLGAGATAVVVPMIERIGMGWTSTFIAGLWIVWVPALMAVVRWGPGMRKRKEEKLKSREERRG